MTMDPAKLERQRAAMKVERPEDGFTRVLTQDPETIPLKKLAWAYSVAPGGSEHEAKLFELLRRRFWGPGTLEAGAANPASDTETSK